MSTHGATRDRKGFRGWIWLQLGDGKFFWQWYWGLLYDPLCSRGTNSSKPQRRKRKGQSRPNILWGESKKQCLEWYSVVKENFSFLQRIADYDEILFIYCLHVLISKDFISGGNFHVSQFSFLRSFWSLEPHLLFTNYSQISKATYSTSILPSSVDFTKNTVVM